MNGYVALWSIRSEFKGSPVEKLEWWRTNRQTKQTESISTNGVKKSFFGTPYDTSSRSAAVPLSWKVVAPCVTVDVTMTRLCTSRAAILLSCLKRIIIQHSREDQKWEVWAVTGKTEASEEDDRFLSGKALESRETNDDCSSDLSPNPDSEIESWIKRGLFHF